MMGHVHHALVGKASLGDLRLAIRRSTRASSSVRSSTRCSSVRWARAQRPLGRVALPVLPLDHAVGVPHDHEQHAVEHAQHREHGERHHPLRRARRARQERRDVVVDLEDGARRRRRVLAAHGDIGGKQIGVLDHPVETAELVAVGELARDEATRAARNPALPLLVSPICFGSVENTVRPPRS